MSRKTTTATNATTTTQDDRWYVPDPSTKRVDSSSNPELAKQIAEIEKAQLPATVKAAALAGLRAQQAASKAFSLQVCRARKDGARDLIEVGGDFKAKMLSPTLVRAIAERAAFVLQTLATYDAQD